MIVRFRAKLCRLLSLHNPIEVSPNLEGHEVVRCKWCNRYWAIENRRRTCRELEFGK